MRNVTEHSDNPPSTWTPIRALRHLPPPPEDPKQVQSWLNAALRDPIVRDRPALRGQLKTYAATLWGQRPESAATLHAGITGRPRSPFVGASKKLDPEIAPLVRALLEVVDFETLGSCWGHGEQEAYVDVAVRGLGGISNFVERLNRVRALLGEGGPWLEVNLNWSDQVWTACDFEQHKDWIMFSIRIEDGEGGPPTARSLKRLAHAWRGVSSRLSRQRARNRGAR